MSKYTCFVISPIGKEGTEIYQDYKDLLDLIIMPALEIYDIKVMRGDHAITEDRIDMSVIKNIQDADVCICDITEPNPNVYYELGRRDETGKPVILLKRKNSPPSPVDIATRRYFEYDWNSRYGIRDAQTAIREFVGPMVEQGFSERGKSATLGDIAETLSRLERKVDRLSSQSSSPIAAAIPGNGDDDDVIGNTDPPTLLGYALMKKNIPLAEKAMAEMQYRMDEENFYDVVVELVASMGSDIAGKMLMEKAEEFFDDGEIAFKKKVDYLECLVSYLNPKGKGAEGMDLVMKLCARLENEAEGEDPLNVAQIYNQKHRLYFGMYSNTNDVEWLDKAIKALNTALKIAPKCEFLYYGLSVCYYAYGNAAEERDYYEKARDAIETCLKYDIEEEADHIREACEVYAKLDDPKLSDMLARYAQLDPIGAEYLEMNLDRF